MLRGTPGLFRQRGGGLSFTTPERAFPRQRGDQKAGCATGGWFTGASNLVFQGTDSVSVLRGEPRGSSAAPKGGGLTMGMKSNGIFIFFLGLEKGKNVA